jgi:hypothetical protein
MLSIGRFNGVKMPPAAENRLPQNPLAEKPSLVNLFPFRSGRCAKDPVEPFRQGPGLGGKHLGCQAR